MTAFTDQYVPFGYWDYDYAVGDSATDLATDFASSIITAPASITSSANRDRLSPAIINAPSSVTTRANYSAVSSGVITAPSSVTAYPIRQYGLFHAVINGASAITTNATRYRLSTGIITSTATVTSLANFRASRVATINAQPNVTARGNAIYVDKGFISANLSISAIGYIYGEEWKLTPIGTSTWLRQG